MIYRIALACRIDSLLDPTSCFFIILRHRGERLRRGRSRKNSLRATAKKIGAGHIHPHQSRHTYATRLMDQGVPMEHIMALGGWKSSAMAKRYARVNPVHLQQHADRLEGCLCHTPDDSKPKPKLP